jgi:hypothetical protein
MSISETKERDLAAHSDLSSKKQTKLNTSKSTVLPLGSPRNKTMMAISERDIQYLEEYLLQRPDRSILVDKNILRPFNVAPTLASAAERVLWEKKTRALQHKITNRPDKNSLIEKGIIKPETQPTREEISFHLETLLKNRPELGELVYKHVLPTQSSFFTSPHIASIQKKLETENQKVYLETKLSKRPKTLEEMERKLSQSSLPIVQNNQSEDSTS